MHNEDAQRLIEGWLPSERDYVIAVTAISPDPCVIDIELRFLAGRTYCCAEPGCHLPKRTDGLSRLSSELPAVIKIRWHCRVEAGAKLKCLASLGLPLESEEYAFDYESGPDDGPRERE